MKLRYFGHACFTLTYADGTVLATDPFDPSVTYPPCNAACTAALVSHGHFDHNYTASLRGDFAAVSAEGEYAFGSVRVCAEPSFHDKEMGARRGGNLLFRVEGEGLRIAHLGDLGHLPNAKQKEFLGDLDVLLIPIGGTYTIDTQEAEQIVRELKPRVTVAMHYRTDAYGDVFDGPEAFEKDMNAVRMPREIEITAENIGGLPAVMLMNYK